MSGMRVAFRYGSILKFPQIHADDYLHRATADWTTANLDVRPVPPCGGSDNQLCGRLMEMQQTRWDLAAYIFHQLGQVATPLRKREGTRHEINMRPAINNTIMDAEIEPQKLRMCYQIISAGQNDILDKWTG
jgi:hypothetical protein